MHHTLQRTLVTPAVLAVLLAVGACAEDPAGAGGAVLLQRLGGREDSALVGAPGKPLPGAVALRVLDGNGEPIAGAVVRWTVIGGGRVERGSEWSDAQGRIEAAWVLGTVASYSQRLMVEVQARGHTAAATISAVATPDEVTAVALKGETTAVKVSVPTTLGFQAIDPFGNRFVFRDAEWASLDTNLAIVDSGGAVVVRKRGYVRFVTTAGSVTDTAWVHGVQIVQSIVVDRDTLHLGAIGDSVTLAVRLLDDQGLPVRDSFPRLVPMDTAVVRVRGRDSLVVRSVANGVANVRLQIGGGSPTGGSTMSVATLDGGAGVLLTRQVVVVVNQVAAEMSVAVTFGNPVITLPAGATLPLACEARDKNGVVIPGQPALVRSIRGTVAGTGCGDARVARSGYDTLVFAAGSIQARVPVIVATRPDSIGVITAAQPLTDDVSIRYVGEDLGAPSVIALRPLVRDILAAYGNPTTNLGRARAIRDWVARTAVHPSEFLHPNRSTSNRSVLPPGVTWADANAAAQAQWDRDLGYWRYLSYDGYVMLDHLLGTLDRATGRRADDGIMLHVAGAQYRMRDLESYRFVLCTFQSVMATTLWAAAGLHGLILQTLGHDPSAVFIPELGKWVYEDVTFSNDYLLDGTGDPLSPAELLTLGTVGTSARARVTKLSGPSYDPEQHIGVSYMNVYPEGFVIMGSRLYIIPRPNPTVWDARFGQIDVPALTGTPFDYPVRVTPEQAFPKLGVVVSQLAVEDSVYIATLSSTLPNHDHFERRTGGSWERVTALDVLPVGDGRVEYRSVDALGYVGATTVLDVWIPRADGFLEAGAPGSPRTRATVVSVTGPDL